MNSNWDSDNSDSISEMNLQKGVYKDSFEFVKHHAIHLAEILPGKLYFATLSKKDDLKAVSNQYLSTVNKLTKKHFKCLVFDKVYEYLPYNKDFGPLNLAMLYMYCKVVDINIQDKSVVIHCTGFDRKTRVNQAFLIGSYSIIYHGQTPKSLNDRWLDIRPDKRVSSKSFNKFEPFVHAGFGICRYQLQLNDCLSGVYRALELKFIDFKTFNCNEYRKHERVENGDFNWIIPKQFIAFCDPETYADNLGVPVSFFVKYFCKNNVGLVVRLNISTYDASNFTDVGIAHKDLIYPDGSIPSDAIVLQFLSLCEEFIPKGIGAVAVHCKAGLGRTGTLIACYMMKHYRFTAKEVIAWLRICRPGSVIGYQQKWLEKKQNWLWKLGDQYYGRVSPKRDNVSRTTTILNDCFTATDDEIDDDLESLMEDINNLGAKLDRTASLLAEERCSPTDQSENFTQGDFLNEIKLHRKIADTKQCLSSQVCRSPKRIDTKQDAGISIVQRIPVLRSRTSKFPTSDINNNLSQHGSDNISQNNNNNNSNNSNNNSSSNKNNKNNKSNNINNNNNNNNNNGESNNNSKFSQLKLSGKKMNKYSSPVRVLPH